MNIRRFVFAILALMSVSGSVAAQGVLPPMEAAVGSSDTLVVPIKADPDLDPTLLVVKLDKGIDFRLLDSTNKIIHADEEIPVVVVFTPTKEGTFSDNLIIYMEISGGAPMLYVPISGLGFAADVTRSASTPLRIYPNPATDLVRFSEVVREASLIDLTGNVIQQVSGVDRMDVSTFSAGRYVLRVQSHDSSQSTPLMLLH